MSLDLIGNNKSGMTFDAHYFYKKFSAIPDELWCTGELIDGPRRCAQGHCLNISPLGLKTIGEESYSLKSLLFCAVPHINDGLGDYIKWGNTPKERILNAIQLASEFQDEI